MKGASALKSLYSLANLCTGVLLLLVIKCFKRMLACAERSWTPADPGVLWAGGQGAGGRHVSPDFIFLGKNAGVGAV